MAQVILSNKQSNSGSPYVIYSVEVTPSNRTMTSVDLAFKITSHLKYDDSKLQTGSGYGLKGRLVINGETLWWDDDTSREGYRTYNAPILKGRWNSWSGKTNHPVSYTYTLTNLSWDTTSIPVTFYVIRTSGNTSNAGYLATTNCTNITIDRGSAPSTITSVSSGTTDFAPSITWTPLDSTFKFELKYYYSNWQAYTGFITPNTTNPYTYNGYTISGSTLAPYMTNATGGTFGVTLFTYDSGGNYIGESSSNFNVTLNGNIVPSASFTQVQEAGDVPSSWGIYVKTKSRVALAISGSGIYGSTITGYRISYYGGAVATQSATTSYIQNSGNVTFTGQVTDTRGRSASTTNTINVVDYSNPTISTAQVQRCDANGNIDNNGEYMYISYGASISSCSNKNTPNAAYKVGYRVHNTGNYTYVDLTTNANSYSANGMLFSDGIKAAGSSGTKVQFSTSNTYDIQFYVKDYFMEYTNLQLLDAGFDLMNFNPSGKAMAIGKVSEAGANEEKLEIGMNTEIDGDLKIIKNGEPRITMNTGTYEAITLLKSGVSTFIGGQGGSIYFRPTNVYNSSNEMRAAADGNFYIKNRTAATNGSITAYINTNQTMSNEYAYLNYNSSYNLSNGTLSVASPDGMIVIGSGVSKVRVSGAIFLENVGSWVGYVYCFLRKNGTNISSTIMSGQAQYFNTLIIPPRILEVSQGDYIQLLVNNPSYSVNSFTARGGSDNTYLLVEAIE